MKMIFALVILVSLNSLAGEPAVFKGRTSRGRPSPIVTGVPPMRRVIVMLECGADNPRIVSINGELYVQAQGAEEKLQAPVVRQGHPPARHDLESTSFYLKWLNREQSRAQLSPKGDERPYECARAQAQFAGMPR